jgi:hypothetical protein
MRESGIEFVSWTRGLETPFPSRLEWSVRYVIKQAVAEKLVVV